MGRRKPSKPRRVRRGADMPRSDEVMVPLGVDLVELAEQYECGHCGARPAQHRVDRRGRHHFDIAHRDACPVRRGVVDGRPDALRAIAAATG